MNTGILIALRRGFLPVILSKINIGMTSHQMHTCLIIQHTDITRFEHDMQMFNKQQQKDMYQKIWYNKNKKRFYR
jgi:hypothetical protein